MYDRTTNTLWRQFVGEPAVGTLVGSGIKLEVLPVVLTTWGDWLATHPDTNVVDINTGFPPERYRPEEHPESAYANYRESPELWYPVWRESDLLSKKSQVLGLVVNGEAKAYPLEQLQQEPVINDSLGGKNLVVITRAESAAARAYKRGSHEFSLSRPGENETGEIVLVDEEGRRWRLEEEALVAVDGPAQRLQRLPSHMAYWFGWYASYPDTGVHGQEGTGP